MTPSAPVVLSTAVDLLGDRVLWGALLAVGAASLLAALVAGTAALAVARWRGYSRAPPRLLAARVLRRPDDAVGRWAPLAVHFGLGLVALAAVGLVYLAASVLTSVLWPAGGPGLLRGPAVTAVLLVVGGAAVWWAVAHRWLPAVADRLDRPVRAVRRQAAVVGVAYAAVAAVVYPPLLFLALMLVFFR